MSSDRGTLTFSGGLRIVRAMKRWILLCAFVSCLGWLTAGCTNLPAIDDPLAEPATDADVTSAVENRLSEDGITGRFMIGVTTRDGVVSLHGRVPDAAVKLRALALVKSTPGVLGVIDDDLRSF